MHDYIKQDKNCLSEFEKFGNVDYSAIILMRKKFECFYK